MQISYGINKDTNFVNNQIIYTDENMVGLTISSKETGSLTQYVVLFTVT